MEEAELLESGAAGEESHWIPEVLFATGSSELEPEFQAILADFFPRYIRILTSPKYRGTSNEVRIEGHTSSDWNGLSSSHLIVNDAGIEDIARSRRVEFKIRTDAETRLAKILEVLQ